MPIPYRRGARDNTGENGFCFASKNSNNAISLNSVESETANLYLNILCDDKLIS